MAVRLSGGVLRLGTVPRLTRASCAALLALLLALRVLTPAGFMPAFERGAVTIVACPDWEPPAAPMAGHHHHSPKKLHQSCPYASASALGGLAGDQPLLPALLALGLALLLPGRAFSFPERHRAHDRPPPRGPPILA
jgi:hypothetical protein